MFVSFLLSAVFTLVHPLHLSVTEIAYDPTEKEFEIILRIFTDDLELAIRKSKNDSDLDLINPQQTTTDKLAWEYLQSKVKIAVEGKEQPVKYLGHEVDDDVLVFYVQVQPVKKFKTVTITNSILTELYDDQANLVNFTVNNKIKSLRLTPDNSSGSLSFDLK